MPFDTPSLLIDNIMPQAAKQYGKRKSKIVTKRKFDSSKPYRQYHLMYGWKQWKKARMVQLHQQPLCENCLANGRSVAASVADHVVPHKGDKVLFFDGDNLQSLCKSCHDKKTGQGY